MTVAELLKAAMADANGGYFCPFMHEPNLSLEISRLRNSCINGFVLWGAKNWSINPQNIKILLIFMAFHECVRLHLMMNCLALFGTKRKRKNYAFNYLSSCCVPLHWI